MCRGLDSPYAMAILLIARGVHCAGGSGCAPLASAGIEFANVTKSLREAPHSVVGENGLVAASCASSGFDYLLAYPAFDRRAQKWQAQAVETILHGKSRKRSGTAAIGPPLCAYSHHPAHDSLLRGHMNAPGPASCDEPLLIDVGANVGFFLYPFLSRGWRAVAFEPIPRNVQALTTNLRLNGWGRHKAGVVHAAASRIASMTTIYAPIGREDNSAIGANSSLSLQAVEKERAATRATAADEVRVATLTLDDYFDGATARLQQSLRLVKIDTQVSILRHSPSRAAAQPTASSSRRLRACTRHPPRHNTEWEARATIFASCSLLPSPRFAGPRVARSGGHAGLVGEGLP